MAGLGKGLGALIPDSDDENKINNSSPKLENEIINTPIKDSFMQAKYFSNNNYDSKNISSTINDIIPHKPKSIELKSEIEATLFESKKQKRSLTIFEDDAVFHIETDKIKPNPDQPRKHFDEDALTDLAHSIREFGVLQPLVVTKKITDTDHGAEVEYQLIAGERRLMASKIAGLERVPVVIRPVGEKREQLELAVIENIQRENLTAIETARAFARLQDEFGLTQREIATRLGKSRESVTNSIRLLNLPSEIQHALEEGKINESQARLLLGINELKEQEKIFKELINENLSVRELRLRIDKKKNGEKKDWQTLFKPSDAESEHVRNELETFFGAPVKVERNGETGKIVISFYSVEELENILSRVNESASKLNNEDDEEEKEKEEDLLDDFVV